MSVVGGTLRGMSDLVFDVALGPTARLLGVTYLHDVDFDQDGPNIQLAPGGRVQVRDECGVTHGGVVIAVEEDDLANAEKEEDL